MTLRPLLALIALTLALCGAGAARAASASAAPQVSFYSTVGQFMCTTCHEPLNQVNSPQAISEKQTLQGLIARGLTVAEIKKAMVDQYGPEVLARPQASGFNLTIYILPPAIFVAGLGLLVYTLPKWRARARAAKPLENASPLPPEDARRLDDELTKFI
jgi:cytochrome c-type biogenesis protein CcmH/NrfF